jgi:hypothetical protein
MNKHKNSGGNQMTLTKSAKRRLSLLAGSSFVAASLAGAVGLALAPTAALAANECGDPAANGATADTFICPVATYATGIQHTSNGDLAVTVQTGSSFGTGGVVTTAGSAADDVSVSLTGTISSSNASFNTAYPILLDARSQSGDVDVTIDVFRTATQTAGIQATNAATTHGVYAHSSGGGDVTVLVQPWTTTFGGRGQLTVTGAAGIAAIEARSVGGGNVSINSGTASGRLYGILSSVDGAGELTIAGSGSANGSVGLAGIHATAGAGLTTITGQGQASAAGASGIFIESDGDVTVTGSGSGGAYGVQFSDIAAGTTSVFNINQSTTGGLAGIRASGAGTLAINVVDILSSLPTGDFTGLAERPVLTVVEGGQFLMNTSQTIPDSYVFTIGEGGIVSVGNQNTSTDITESPVTMTFADTGSVFTNSGYLVIGPRTSSGIGVPAEGIKTHEAELVVAGVSEFHNAGQIMLGGGFKNTVGIPDPTVTDKWYDDILSLPGITLVGAGGHIYMDVDPSGTQADCTRDPVTGDLAAADCVMIPGGATEGPIYVALVEPVAGDRGRLNTSGIVLVDVTGGTSAQGDVVIGPAMAGWSPMFGGSADKGIFRYVIGYDEDTQRHSLYTILSDTSYQFSRLGTAAQSLWRTSTGTWLERQADLRGDIDEGVGGGVWLRTIGQKEDRDLSDSTEAGGATFTYDNSSEQTSYAVTGGIDLMNGADGEQAYVLGLMAGYAHSDVTYAGSVNEVRLNGGSLGAYASYLSGGFYLDGLINAHRLTMRQEAPGFNFFPEGTLLSTRVMTMGLQLDSGWRFPVTANAFVEPLVGLSYVRADLEDFDVQPDDTGRPGLRVSYDDPTSLRGSVGGRIGLEQDFGVVRAQFSVLGRLWNEFKGENGVTIDNEAFPTDPQIVLIDDFGGRFTEAGLGASVYSAGGAVSGFLNVGGKFADDYEAQTASAGVRVAF